MTKTRILHIIKSLGRGGAEMLLPESLKLHDLTRFEFHYIYFLPWKNQLVSTIEEAGGVVHCLPARHNILILMKFPRLVSYIRKHNIQVVHCHLPWAGMVGRIIHRLLRVPVIYTEHNKQERYHVATRWMNRLTFNWQSCAIAVSNDVAKSIRKNIRVSIPVHEIVNGVNTDYFQRDVASGISIRQQSGIPDLAFVVGTIAVFRFQKRLKEWLEVFEAVSAKHSQLYGIIVGDGPLKDELIDRVKSLGLENKIIMPGLQIEVRPWLSAMDVFMMSSEFEGLPVALLEAMSMECAVVTTDAGGIKQVIQHKKNGLIVGSENWKQLADELLQLIDQTDLRKALSQAARTRVQQTFGIGKMVTELENLYSGYR